MSKLTKVSKDNTKEILQMIASIEATMSAILVLLGQIKDKMPEPKKPKKK